MLFKCKVLISLFMYIAKNIFSGFNQSIKERKTTMQVSKVSFVNFSAGKKITPKEVKKAVNPMEEFVHNEKDMYKFYPPREVMGNPNQKIEDKYAKEYAENRKAMQNMEIPKNKEAGEEYFTPFAPTEKNI